jgi:class 3 adenylate cyclase
VNLASRIQSAAAPAQILLSPTAYQRVKEYVEARELQPIEVKGFSEPITVYELLGLSGH